jgi:hypothetical protein
MMESQQHWDGKVRLEKLLLENEWSIRIRDGDDSYIFQTYLGDREYWPDLMAWHEDYGWVVFEVDGEVGHTSKTAELKMEIRDTAFRKHDIATVRIKTADLVGKKKRTDDVLLADIDYQMLESV